MQYQENYVRPKPLAERMTENGLSDPSFVLDYYNTMSEYDPSIDGELTGEKYFKVKTVNVKTSYFEYWYSHFVEGLCVVQIEGKLCTEVSRGTGIVKNYIAIG